MVTVEEAKNLADLVDHMKVSRTTFEKTMADALRDLAAKVEALQADAERYRWIRDKLEGTDFVVDFLKDEAPSRWDEAIDAARKDQP